MQPTNPAWWATLAAAAGAFATALWGHALGTAVQTALTGSGGLVVAVYVHEHHATKRATTAATAAVAVAKANAANQPAAAPGAAPPAAPGAPLG